VTAGQAEIVTDRIAALTEDGVLLESGRELPADIVVTATELQVLPLGGMTPRLMRRGTVEDEGMSFQRPAGR
jgi:monooxygenase